MSSDIDDIYRKKGPSLPAILGVSFAVAAIVALFVWPRQKDEAEPESAPAAAPETAPQPAPAAQPAEAAVPAPAAQVPEAPAAVPFVTPEPEKIVETAAEAVALEKEGRIREARDYYAKALAGADDAKRPSVESELGRLNMELYTTARPGPGKVEYTVADGDSLAKLADRYVCPVTLIQKINHISDPSRIRPGQKLVILDHPKFDILVSKKSNTLTLSLDGAFFKKYTVVTGRDSGTPSGTYKMVDKIEHPSWWTEDGRSIPYGDKDNILGTHWLSLEATGETPRVSGIGIHGTWDNASLGTQSSAGCVRMRNADIEELFTMLPRGTPVKIVE